MNNKNLLPILFLAVGGIAIFSMHATNQSQGKIDSCKAQCKTHREECEYGPVHCDDWLKLCNEGCEGDFNFKPGKFPNISVQDLTTAKTRKLSTPGKEDKVCTDNCIKNCTNSICKMACPAQCIGTKK